LNELIGYPVTTRLTLKNVPIEWDQKGGAKKVELNEAEVFVASPTTTVFIDAADGTKETFLLNKAGAIHLDSNPMNDNLYIFFNGGGR
jgi:hypothetical protein